MNQNIVRLFLASIALAPSVLAQIKLAPVDMGLLPVLSRAKNLGPAGAEQALTVAVSLPYAHPAEVQRFVDDVSNPDSPNYRHFITPEEVGERFGLPQTQIDAVAAYLSEYGFTVTQLAANHLAVIANGTVAQAEQAFHTTIRAYSIVPQNKIEPSQFTAYSTALQLPANLAAIVIDVFGLETYTRPEPRTTLLTPLLTRGLYKTAAMFGSGVTGTGRKCGVSNFDGFRSADWLSYISHFALPVSVGGAGTNITVVAVSGGGTGAGGAAGEGDLDIQMELGMAPLANIRIYDSPPGANLIAVLSSESSENQCDTISESYGWQLPAGTATSAHNIHVSMSAQGITYMAASGDSGTSVEPYSYPNFEPEVLAVGGTVANVNSGSGARVTETGWGGSGGGWSINAATFNVRPAWQVGTGVPAINASNNHRLTPDVAFHAAGSGTGAYQFYSGGGLQSGAIGTSFASPILAGMLALVEQQAIALGGLPADGSGHRRLGRVANLIYSQNGTSTIWYDILSGGNGNLPAGQGASTAHAGWDTVTGWGPMDCGAFATAVACGTGGCAPGTAFCAGDGSDVNVSALCPCFNFGATGRGCDNSAATGGASLTIAGTTNPDTIVLTSSNELATSLSIFVQGDALVVGGSVFGDGIRCAGGSLKRLYAKNASGGVVSAPGVGDLSISARSAQLGDPFFGVTRYYQVYYRDPNLAFCAAPSGDSWNVSNGMIINWP